MIIMFHIIEKVSTLFLVIVLFAINFFNIITNTIFTGAGIFASKSKLNQRPNYNQESKILTIKKEKIKYWWMPYLYGT